MVVFVNTIILAAVPAPMLAPATFVLAGIFQVPLDRIAVLSGYQLLVVGCFGFVTCLVTELATNTGAQATCIGTCSEVWKASPIRFCCRYGDHWNISLRRQRREL